MKHKTFKNYLYILPSFIGFFWLFLYPFLMGLIYSVQRSRFNTSFVGIQNYIGLFKIDAFRLAMSNTGLFMGIGIPMILFTSYCIAYALVAYKMPTWVKVALILPMGIPSATTVAFFRAVFGGLLETQYAMIGVWIIYFWRSMGYNLLIYIAAFEMMDRGPVEAARIDGANSLQIHEHVIFPLTLPATQFVTILSTMSAFKVFKDVYVLEGAYPNTRIYMLQHFMNNTYYKLQYEKLSAAAYTFLMVLLLIGGLIYIRSKKPWQIKSLKD